MNLKLIYGLIAGLLSFIAGCLFILAVFTGAGLLFNAIFQETSWPSWSWIFFRILGVLSFLGFIIIEIWGIRKGFSFGEVMEKELDVKPAMRLAKIYLVVILIALGIFIQFTTSKILSVKHKIFGNTTAANGKANVMVQRDAIMGLYVRPLSDELRIDVNVLKSSMDVHRLTLELAHNKPFWEISRNVSLNYSKQKFVFNISFAEILPKFPKANPQDSEVNFTVKARLDSLVTNEDGSVDASQPPVLASELTLLAKFYFECGDDECRIVKVAQR